MTQFDAAEMNDAQTMLDRILEHPATDHDVAVVQEQLGRYPRGMMAVGAYIGLASDECIRAVCMALRWRSGKWRAKGFIQRKSAQ